MNKAIPIVAALGIILAVYVLFSTQDGDTEIEAGDTEEMALIELEDPRLEGPLSVEEAIFQRVSRRNFSDKPVQKGDLGQLLWSAVGKTVQGVTGPTRAYPSAGGINPLAAYAVVGNVQDMEPGIYKYIGDNHSLEMLVPGDHRRKLMEASFNQRMVAQAAVNIVITGDLSRVERRYGEDRGPRYMAMDVGAAGQNIHLQAEALNLGTVIVGAFQDAHVRQILQRDEQETPLYIMPIGHLPDRE